MLRFFHEPFSHSCVMREKGSLRNSKSCKHGTGQSTVS
jgi:hypothetical protein